MPRCIHDTSLCLPPVNATSAEVCFLIEGITPDALLLEDATYECVLTFRAELPNAAIKMFWQQGKPAPAGLGTLV